MKPNGSKRCIYDALTRSETTCRTSFSSRIGRQASVGVRWGLCWGTRDVCKPFRQGLDIFKKMRIWINRMWRLSGLSGIEDVLTLAIPAFSFQDISPSVTSSKMLYAGLPSPIRVPGVRSVMNHPLAETQESFHASHLSIKWRVYGKARWSVAPLHWALRTDAELQLWHRMQSCSITVAYRVTVSITVVTAGWGNMQCQVRFLHALQLKLQAGPVGFDVATWLVFWGMPWNAYQWYGSWLVYSIAESCWVYIQLNQVLLILLDLEDPQIPQNNAIGLLFRIVAWHMHFLVESYPMVNKQRKSFKVHYGGHQWSRGSKHEIIWQIQNVLGIAAR